MSELLPCPFCGGQASQQESHCDREEMVVRCHDCCAEMPDGYIQGWDRKDWNRRTPPPVQWIKANSERRPMKDDGDCEGQVWAFFDGFVWLCKIEDVYGGYHWTPTNLKKPDPPKI